MTTPPERLVKGRSALSRLLEAAERESAPPPVSLMRVWRRVVAAREQRRPARVLAVFAFAAAAAAAAVLLWPRTISLATLAERSGVVELSGASGVELPAGAGVSVGEGQALVALRDARITVNAETRVGVPRERTMDLFQGEVSVVTHGLVTIAAGAVRVEAVSASFLLRMETRGITLNVREGTVRVGDKAVSAGESWSTIPPEPPLRLEPPRPAEPPPAPAIVEAPRPPRQQLIARIEEPVPAPLPPPETDEALHGRAQTAESEGRYAEAAALYAELSEHAGPRAGTSLYELARVRQRFLAQPGAALLAIDEYRRRFPDGPLAQETSLNAIEARLVLGDEIEALREMDSFLDRWAGSERATEVRWLRAQLLAGRGQCSADLEALAAQGPRADEASFALASCVRKSGEVERARALLEAYLQRFPGGRHAAEVARALGREAP